MWNELPHGLDLRNSWNFMWSWSKIRIDISKLLVWQKCNHFPHAMQLCRKDNLKKNLERAMRISQSNKRFFYVMPETYVLPKEYVAFIETFLECEEKDGKQNYWIVKPAAKSRGRGIFVINDVTQITYGEPLVVQKYLKNPLLMNGFKFDLRIYVTVTSYNPLEAFIYKEGFARLSTTPFTLDPESMTNKFIHLTNYSIQKKAINRSDIDNSYGGTKISLTSLKKYYKEKGLDYEDMWEQSKAI
jgi:tubulin polyglutamylase TTLL5